MKTKNLRTTFQEKNFFNTYFNAKATEDRLKKHLFIAEFSGSLSEVSIKNGTAIVFGQKIAKYHSPKSLEFESSTSIKNTLLVKNKAKVLLKSDEFEGERLGYVSRINKIINANSQNMSVFIESTDNDLYNGMYVFGEIIVGEAENTFLVKRNLIDKNQMYVIVGNKLVSKKIEIIQVSEENAVIRGLKNNDLILNESIKDAYDGMEIRYKN